MAILLRAEQGGWDLLPGEIDVSDLSLVGTQPNQEIPDRDCVPRTAQKPSRKICLFGQRPGIEDPLHPFGHSIGLHEVPQLIGGIAARVMRQLAIEKDQRELQSIRFGRGQIQPLHDAGQVHALEKLEIRGVTEKIRHVPLPAANDLVGPSRVDGRQTLAMDEKSDSRLTRYDRLHQRTSSLIPAAANR